MNYGICACTVMVSSAQVPPNLHIYCSMYHTLFFTQYALVYPHLPTRFTVVTNKKHWQAVEERLFQELYTLGWQYEHNKSLTAEQGMQGGLAAVRQTARRIA